MSLRHKAYLLDADEFRRNVAPILALLDSGDARPLFRQALSVIHEHEQGGRTWILDAAGSVLFDIRRLDWIGRPRSSSFESELATAADIAPPEIGYWLLIVFSSYLRKCLGIGGDYQILADVLSTLNWTQEDIQSLLKGTPTSLLLKPSVHTLDHGLSIEDPYWYWMRPGHSATSGGWLSGERIDDLYSRLTSDREAILAYDYRRFDIGNAPPDIVSDGQRDYLRRMHAAYERATIMLETAQRSDRELYVVVSYQ